MKNTKAAVVFSLNSIDVDAFRDLQEHVAFQHLKKAFENHTNVCVPGLDHITASQMALYDAGVMAVFKAVEDLSRGVVDNSDDPYDAIDELEPENIPVD